MASLRVMSRVATVRHQWRVSTALEPVNRLKVGLSAAVPRLAPDEMTLELVTGSKLIIRWHSTAPYVFSQIFTFDVSLRGVIRSFVHAEKARRQLRREAPTRVDEAFVFAQTREIEGFSLRATQIESEFKELLRLATGARRVLEIGTSNGGSLFVLCRAAADDARLVTVDMPGGGFSYGYGGNRLRAIGWFLRGAARNRQVVRMIQGDSHSPGTIRRAERALKGGADLVFIDGDHSYEGVKADYESYARFARPGGLIAFHDIVPGRAEDVGGVPVFWAEVKQGREHLEFVESWDQGGWGIGVLTATAGSEWLQR
jgi:predicted O-methyltransferase YrrM